jgi:hypothetical protein
MASAKKTMSERAVDRLEERGYLKLVRAEMRAEVMECLVDLEEKGAIPSELRIKRYTPESDDVKRNLSYVLEYLRANKMTHTVRCFKHEINGKIDEISLRVPSTIADAIKSKRKATKPEPE